MRIKLLLSIIFSLFSLAVLAANDEAKSIKASLNEATVFFNGAELVHKASVQVTKGVNDIWITELSPNIDVNSLKISATKGLVVASYEYSQDFINLRTATGIEKVLKDSVKYYQKRISEYEINKQTNKDLLDLLKANKSIGGAETGLNVSELVKMVEYYSSKSNELNRQDAELAEKIAKAEEAVERLESQLSLESAKNVKSVGVLKLNLTSPQTASSDLTITYYTKNANWIPYYDVNVPSTEEKIQIASKAKVAQTTGLDWQKVKLTLSTATPSVNKEAPLFDAWFLDYQHNYGDYGASSLRFKNKESLSQNSVMYDSKAGAAVPGNASGITIRGTSTIKESEGPLYLINGEIATAEDVQNLDPNMIAEMNVLKDASATGLYGSRASNGVVMLTTKTLNDFVKRDEGELNTVYNIDLPYTILGNGKTQSIDLETQLVDAEFKHYAVPKLDKDVFIVATIDNWQTLGLLSGKANVTFSGTYVGETIINTNSVSSKLSLTLGADKRVTVKRVKLQDFSSKKFLGGTIKQDFTYKITVKNNQNKSIKMVLKDQYPQSKQKDIQVEMLKETTPTSFIFEDAGVLNWDFELAPGESKEFKVGYSVKYPKDSNINL